MLKVQPSATAMREFTAVALAMKLVGKEIRSDINKATRDTLNPIWRTIIGIHAAGKMDQLILVKGARIRAGNPASAMAGTSTKALSGGGKPVDLSRAWEFGSTNRAATMTYDRKNKKAGGTHSVTRRTQRQVPGAQRNGRVVYPAFAEIAPRMVSLWVQIIVRKIYEAYERR